jgi:ornithine carbamoyltransferase
VDAIMIRTNDHAKIEELSAYASVPVINGLTDASHPCQIVADLLTLVERGIALEGLELAWLGDGNNVLHSLIEAAGLLGFNIRVGGPKGYEPDAGFVERARAAGASITFTQDAAEAVAGAQAVVTDTWVSMGQAGGDAVIAAMQPYQVNEALMARAAPGAVFLHCLPAHRGEEVTDAVIDSAQSVVWDEAENRIHAQKSVLRWAFGQI